MSLSEELSDKLSEELSDKLPEELSGQLPDDLSGTPSDKLASVPMTDAVSRHLGVRPGKVVAVHLNYPSRADQRGRRPASPSYFLKPSSSLCGSGRVERPEGAELLAFEGEIALVIGERAHRVTPEAGWSHVAWVTAANDLGLYDLRAADRGSNVRSKGGDGFTPLGPVLLPASAVDPAALRVRTWLDGELVQDDSTATLLFDFGYLIADLSRLLTLEVGDVILTGTPAGAAVAQPGQVVEVEVGDLSGTASTGRLRTEVVAGPPLAPWGNQPRVDDALRADAHGVTPTPPGLAEPIARRLGAVAVATLAAVLRRRGYGDCTIDGVRPLVPGRRLLGTARTLRYVPYRKDLFEKLGGGFTPQKKVVDLLLPGEVLVMEARGDASAGTLGDILALRAQVRGAAGIITDGSVRDAAMVADVDLPVYAAGSHPQVLGRRHVPFDIDVTVGCGGATVQVGDVLVGDDDGVVVIPPALVEDVLAEAEETEHAEAWISAQVREGASLDGLYPLTGDWRRRYEEETGGFRAGRGNQ